jgi:aspartokinase/homoserine dehydrogenase 1
MQQRVGRRRRQAGAPGVAGTAFSALANVGINVRAFAQGSSERTISMVIDQRQAERGRFE